MARRVLLLVGLSLTMIATFAPAQRPPQAPDRDRWVNEEGDTMTGALVLSPAMGDALVTTAGRVGIGTLAPAYLLDVAGNVNLEGNLLMNGGLFAHNNGGFGNLALGVYALASVRGGDSNTAVGGGTLSFNLSGQKNTAVGFDALADNQGNWNTAVGVSALIHNTVGSHNTAVGGHALRFGGVGNTAVGGSALKNSTGQSNTAIGYQAGIDATDGSDNVFISHPGVAGDSGAIRIGSAGLQSKTFVAGVRGVMTDLADAVVVVIDSDGQLGTVSSSRRFKKDIGDMGDASAAVMSLRPVTFRYRRESASGRDPLRYGLIAEEVAEVYPDLVAYSDGGQAETVLYHLLTPMLLNEIQNQQRRFESQEKQLRELMARVEQLER